MKRTKNYIGIALSVMMLIAFMPLVGGQASAATKPGAIKTLTVKFATEATCSGQNVKTTLSWSKSKNAKSYDIANVTKAYGWKYVKKVKKTAANKKRYNVPGKYKTKVSGKYYKVYQYKLLPKYRVIATSKKQAGSVRLPEGESFTFAVRGVNGKTCGAWKSVKIDVPAAQAKEFAEGEEAVTDIPGSVVPVCFEGTYIPMTIGQECEVPLIGTRQQHTRMITPEKIEVSEDGEFQIYWGKTTVDEEICYSSRYTFYPGCEVQYTDASGVDYDWDYDTYYLGEDQAFLMEEYYNYKRYTVLQSLNQNVNLYWTLDGAEPQVGQDDATMNAEDYPFGPVVWGASETHKPIKVKGTVIASDDEESYLWGECKSSLMEKHIWTKAYDGDQMIFENYSVTYPEPEDDE